LLTVHGAGGAKIGLDQLKITWIASFYLTYASRQGWFWVEVGLIQQY
jgi:hypothetical protein